MKGYGLCKDRHIFNSHRIGLVALRQNDSTTLYRQRYKCNSQLFLRDVCSCCHFKVWFLFCILCPTIVDGPVHPCLEKYYKKKVSDNTTFTCSGLIWKGVKVQK